MTDGANSGEATENPSIAYLINDSFVAVRIRSVLLYGLVLHVLYRTQPLGCTLSLGLCLIWALCVVSMHSACIKMRRCPLVASKSADTCSFPKCFTT